MPYRVYAGIEASEMAQQLHKAGYYYPDAKQDMWVFGLLMFCVFRGKDQLPHEHQKAIREGNTLLFASKLCSQRKYTEWKEQVISETASKSMNDCVTCQADSTWVESGIEPVRAC